MAAAAYTNGVLLTAVGNVAIATSLAFVPVSATSSAGTFCCMFWRYWYEYAQYLFAADEEPTSVVIPLTKSNSVRGMRGRVAVLFWSWCVLSCGSATAASALPGGRLRCDRLRSLRVFVLAAYSYAYALTVRVACCLNACATMSQAHVHPEPDASYVNPVRKVVHVPASMPAVCIYVCVLCLRILSDVLCLCQRLCVLCLCV